jgi:hypothetical protein
MHRSIRTPRQGHFTALLLLALAWLFAACGGGGSGADQRTTAGMVTPAAATSHAAQGTLLQSNWSAYPRLVRLAHQAVPALNGRIVASLTETVNGAAQTGFHASDDDGATFRRLGALRDAAYDGGLCCGTLFELPVNVGALPAGTLLYAASIGQQRAGAFMQQPIFRSDDGGATFRRVGDNAVCGRAARARKTDGSSDTGVWEPEFLIDADRATLACIFSDETEPGWSQVLKITTTTDGLHWTAPRVIVAGPAATDRPGMAVVRRLPNGRYAMSLERCSLQRLYCAAHLRFSQDGLDWGAPAAGDVRPQTAEGRFLRHAPMLTWAPAAGRAGGALLLIGQLVATADGGVDAANNGQALLVDDSGSGNGPWQLATTPIGLASAPAVGNTCQNYSTAMLPSADGTRLVMMQTDFGADGSTCVARYGSGLLGR